MSTWLNYCVCAPVKIYDKIFKKWLNSVLSFKPPPKEIILASEYKFPEDKRYTLLHLEEPYIPEKLKEKEERHYRIGTARENIKRYIVDKSKYDFIFFLDSDVIINEYSPLILSGIMSMTSSQLVINEFKNLEGYPPISLGCLLITRQLLELCTFYPHGFYSEDSVFYSSLINLFNFGYKFKCIYGRIIKVDHYQNGEKQSMLEPDLILKEFKNI